MPKAAESPSMITMKTADGFVYRKRAAGASNASPQKRQKSIVLSRKKMPGYPEFNHNMAKLKEFAAHHQSSPADGVEAIFKNVLAKETAAIGKQYVGDFQFISEASQTILENFQDSLHKSKYIRRIGRSARIDKINATNRMTLESMEEEEATLTRVLAALTDEAKAWEYAAQENESSHSSFLGTLQSLPVPESTVQDSCCAEARKSVHEAYGSICVSVDTLGQLVQEAKSSLEVVEEARRAACKKLSANELGVPEDEDEELIRKLFPHGQPTN